MFVSEARSELMVMLSGCALANKYLRHVAETKGLVTNWERDESEYVTI